MPTIFLALGLFQVGVLASLTAQGDCDKYIIIVSLRHYLSELLLVSEVLMLSGLDARLDGA